MPYLDRAEDPEYEGLPDGESSSPHTKGKVDADEFADIWVIPGLLVCLGPPLQPNGTS